jgi:hypothetical protein
MPTPMYFKVLDKRTGNEREITKKAYSILPKRYQLLEEIPNSQASVPLKRNEKVAQPVVVAEVKKPQTEEEIQAKREELNAMNQAAIQKAEAKEEGIKVRQKPGPKAKIKTA